VLVQSYAKGISARGEGRKGTVTDDREEKM
jgi:hypothetical protein